MSHVFISYSTRNGEYAQKLAEKLRVSGFDVWIDNARLRSSDNWWESIVYALKDCGAFVVIMTPESRESRWVQREATLADNWGRPTFPLLLSGENWEMYVLTQYSDVRDGTLPPQQFLDKLADAAPRSASQGRIVTPKQSRERSKLVEVPDADVRAAIADAPVGTYPSKKTKKQTRRKPQPKQRGCLLTALVGGLIGFVMRWAVRLAILGFVLGGLLMVFWDDVNSILDEVFDITLDDYSYTDNNYGSTSGGSANSTMEDARIYIESGYAALNAGMLYEAQDSFDNAIAIDPYSSEAYFQRGITFERLGNPDSAIQDFYSAMDNDYEPIGEVKYALARNYASLGDYDTAIEFAAETTGIDEWNVENWYLAAYLASELGYYEDAAYFYEQGVAHGGSRDGDFEMWLWERGVPVYP